MIDPKKPVYWLFVTRYECPICGRGGETRERRYDPRPEDGAKRHRWEEAYDWCDAL